MEKALPPLAVLLRSLRAKSGLSLSACAERMNMSKGHLHGLESGKAENPTVSTVATLAAQYGVSPTTILKASLPER